MWHPAEKRPDRRDDRSQLAGVIFLNASRPWQPLLLIRKKTSFDRLAACQNLPQNTRIFYRLGRALGQEGQHGMRRIAHQRDTARDKACGWIAISERPFLPRKSSVEQIPRGFVPAHKMRFEKSRLARARPKFFFIRMEILVHDRDDIDDGAATQGIMDKMRLAPEPKVCFLPAHGNGHASGLDRRAPGGAVRKSQSIAVQPLPNKGAQPIGADKAIARHL